MSGAWDVDVWEGVALPAQQDGGNIDGEMTLSGGQVDIRITLTAEAVVVNDIRYLGVLAPRFDAAGYDMELRHESSAEDIVDFALGCALEERDRTLDCRLQGVDLDYVFSR